MTAELTVDPTPVRLRRNRVAVGPVSFLVRPRRVIVGALLAVLVVGLFCGSVAVSDYPMSLFDAIRILFGGGTRIENVIVFDAQLPRAWTAALVGAGFGLSGALTQTITRNPLATPDFLGISAGASVGAVVVITIGASWGLGAVGIPVAALIGGFAAAAAMYVLSWRRGGLDPLRLVLVGVALTWALQGIVGYLLTRALVTDATRAQTWLVGSVGGADWSAVKWPAIGVAIGVVAVIAGSRALSVLPLDADSIRGLGVHPSRAAGALLMVAVAVAALCVASAGPVAFVALLAPQIALRLSRTPAPGPLTSALCGAALVLAGDLICRTLLPVALPVGVVTAALGGPALIYLMLMTSRRGGA